MPANGSSGDVRWIDGLRGVASFLVVNAHLARSIAPILLSPAVGEHQGPLPWQLPLVRNLFMGRSSIALFAIVAGFVNALKPLRLIRQGDVATVLPNISRTAFRRTWRFVLPAMLMTCFTWLSCQLGAFRLAKHVEWEWIRDTAPEQSDGVLDALRDLYLALGRTWTQGANVYDPVQWTLSYLLRSSMFVYLTLVATAFLKSKWRYAVFATMYAYYYWMGEATFSTNIFFGLALAEMNDDAEVQQIASKPPATAYVASTLAVFVGMVCISYPERNPDWAPWSAAMRQLGEHIFPVNAEMDRFYPSLGAQLIVMAIFFSPFLKQLLSSPILCWMGKVSLPVYMIHAPLMRSLLTWAVFGLSGGAEPAVYDPDTDSVAVAPPIAPYRPWLTVLAILGFYALLYRGAAAWVRWVDPFCGRIAKRIEDVMFADEEEREKMLITA